MEHSLQIQTVLLVLLDVKVVIQQLNAISVGRIIFN